MAKHTKLPPGAVWSVIITQALRENSIKLGGIFDELVVDDWLRIERMTERHWWMRLGQINFDIIIDHVGKAEIRVRNGTIKSMGDGVNVLVEK